ncbi:MAG: hypothetical protein A3H98_01905 [Bacteroidetes bacterium RIFCSPLOWO2_02_FULL_36_8]|nr:MAG: hypothetical protein A3H98_01905 [Bacteroidetes bacterium RIFCSPLOWO2_02_FULL_36_8]OFY70728.1 MAG: hypothetical protein A3G23_08420 [Bacteroidetes bacterium RIFCSPLOWO2_12_FULL_37_12]
MKLKILAPFFFLVIVLMFSCKKEEDLVDLSDVNCSSVTAKYSADIVPIVNASCAKSSCHNAGSSKGDFTTYAGLKVKADNGTLTKAIVTEQYMPKSGTLTKEQRAKFKCWIESGAPQN